MTNWSPCLLHLSYIKISGDLRFTNTLTHKKKQWRKPFYNIEMQQYINNTNVLTAIKITLAQTPLTKKKSIEIGCIKHETVFSQPKDNAAEIWHRSLSTKGKPWTISYQSNIFELFFEYYWKNDNFFTFCGIWLHTASPFHWTIFLPHSVWA